MKCQLYIPLLSNYKRANKLKCPAIALLLRDNIFAIKLCIMTHFILLDNNLVLIGISYVNSIISQIVVWFMCKMDIIQFLRALILWFLFYTKISLSINYSKSDRRIWLKWANRNKILEEINLIKWMMMLNKNWRHLKI